MVEIALFYPLIAIASFAMSSAIIRDLDRIGSPIYLNMLRASVGAIAFVILLLLYGKLTDVFSIGLTIMIYLVMSVFFNVVVGDTLYFYAQNTLGIKIATPVVNIYPFVTVLFSYMFLGESISKDFFLGGILIIIGVVILSQDVDKQEVEIENVIDQKKLVIIAFFAAFGAVICYALGVIFTTVGSSSIDTNVANGIRMPAAAIILSSGAIVKSKSRSNSTSPIIKIPVNQLSKNDIIKIIMAGVLGTFISSFYLVLSTQELGAGRTAILLSIGPVFSLPLAIFWLKERFGVLTLGGTILSLIGLWVIIA